MTKIEPTPKRTPAFDPTDPRYGDARDLEGELRRVFEICHNCRMCVNYCGTFPDMFSRIDRDIETRGAVGSELLGADDFKSATELCWQCKLCYIKCPYTPDEGHAWQVDLPRLLTREKVQRTARDGMSVEDAALGEPGLLGKLTAGPMARVANFVNASRLVRKIGEKAAGIAADFPLPPFATTTFERWLAAHEPLAGAGSEGTLAIFATCQGDYNFPSRARQRRPGAREERLPRRAARSGLLRHPQHRRRRSPRGPREGRGQRADAPRRDRAKGHDVVVPEPLVQLHSSARSTLASSGPRPPRRSPPTRST